MQVLVYKGKKPIWLVLLVVAILLLPYDAVRFLPSFYSPLTLIPLLLMLPFSIAYFFRNKLDTRLLFVVGFWLFGLLSALVTWSRLGNTEEVFDFTVTLTLGIIFFVAFDSGFRRVAARTTVREYVLWFCRLACVAYSIPLFVGVLETLSLIGVLPASVNDSLRDFFGGWQTGRLTLTNYEAAWAAMHLLICMPLYFFCYKEVRKPLYLIAFVVSVFLFMYAMSAHGFVSAAAGLFLGAVLVAYSRGSLIQFLKVFLPVVILIVVGVAAVYGIALNSPSTYFTRRVIEFTDVDSLIRSDGSSFVRIIYPSIGLRMFLENPLFGLGAGSFTAEFPRYIFNDFQWAIAVHDEVRGNVFGGGSVGAICLYTRILGEMGLVGGVLLLGAIVSAIKQVKLIGAKPYWPIVIWAALTLCLMLQFSSLCFVPFWMVLAFIGSLGYCKAEVGRDESRSFDLVRK